MSISNHTTSPQAKAYSVTVTTVSGKAFTEGPFPTIQKAKKEARRWMCGTWVAAVEVEAAQS